MPPAGSPSKPSDLYRLQMMCFVEAQHAAQAIFDINLVHTAGTLLDAPIGCQRQSEKLQQQDAVHAVVAYQHNRFVIMPREHES